MKQLNFKQNHKLKDARAHNWLRSSLSVIFILLLSKLAVGNKLTKVDQDLSDQQIRKAIAKEFEVRPTLPSEAISIIVMNGIVTLNGQVENLLEKERATEVALAVRGVKEVISQINVKSSSKSDEAISKEINQALLLNAATDSYEVKPMVEKGIVTLTGNVDSWNEAFLSEKVTKGVKGVRGVENKIVFNYVENRVASEIAAGIRERLRFDTRVNDALVSVKVNNGHVVLEGTVGSASEIEQAFYDAWISGVKSVDITGLRVDPEMQIDELQKNKYDAKSDIELRSAIYAALFYDGRVNSYNILVDPRNGTVTLSGNVDNLSAKRAADDLTKNIAGVDSVVNNIKINIKDFDRAIVKDKVERSFFLDPLLDNFQIATSVSDGKVTLTGAVNTYYEKFRAEDLASMVRGVSSVENKLKVKNTHSIVYYDYMEPLEVKPRKTDKEIKDDIERQLWWSPFVDANEVDVLVNGGKATLLGTVDSWKEEQSAIENAYEGGAVSIDNKLLIDNP